MQYEENMPPVSVEYREQDTNKVAKGTSVFDHEEEEGMVEGDWAFTVHGLTGENLNSMTPTALKAMALRHLNSGGKMLAVGHSDKFQSMWHSCIHRCSPGSSHMVWEVLVVRRSLTWSINGIFSCTTTSDFKWM